MVNPHHIEDYDEFRRHPDPLDLKDEMAALRTLIVEFRDSITQNNMERRQEFAKAIALSIAAEIRDNPQVEEWFPEREERIEFAKMVAHVSYGIVPEAYKQFFGNLTRISPEEAKTLAILTDSVGKLSERHRKMLEERTLTVTYDSQMVNMLMQFMGSVMPMIPDASRPEVVTAARTFFGQLRASKHEVIDAV